MFRKGNRQIRNSSSLHTNGNIKHCDDGDLGVCCLFPSHLLQAISRFIRKQRLGPGMYRGSHCLDHSASSPPSSSSSGKCSSLPLGGGHKGEFSHMLVAMGMRVRKRAAQQKLASQHKTFPCTYDSLWALWRPGWKYIAKKSETSMSKSITFKQFFIA